MLLVRERTSNDVAACVAILKDVYADVGYPVRGVDDALEFLTGSSLASWVAVEDGEVVGHVCITAADRSDAAVALWMDQNPNDTSIAELSRLFTQPNRQRAGIASALVEKATAWAAAQNVRLILMALDLPRLQPAIRFYKRSGWRKYGDTESQNSKDLKIRPAQCFTNP